MHHMSESSDAHQTSRKDDGRTATDERGDDGRTTDARDG